MGSWRELVDEGGDWLRLLSGKMGGEGAIQAVFVLILQATLAEPNFRVSKCVSTIVSCCNPGQPAGQHPFRCFEVNECAGLYWEGKNACSGSTVARAIAALSNVETRVAHVDDTRVEIEIEHQSVKTVEQPQNKVGDDTLEVLEVMGPNKVEIDIVEEKVVRPNEVQVTEIKKKFKRPFTGRRKNGRRRNRWRGNRNLPNCKNLKNHQIHLKPGQRVRPKVHPASNKNYLTIGGIAGPLNIFCPPS